MKSRGLKRFFRLPVDDVLTAMEHLMTGARPGRVMIVTMVAMIVTWFLYVPVHELLHVYGCIWTGGEVTELHLQAHYGGKILSRWFDFIVTGGDYAGQVTGFDTHGNDWIYLATDFGPFMLTVLFGVALLRLCTRKRRVLMFGPALVIGMAPFYNVPGDYYEMASIMTTRALTWVGGGGSSLRFEGLRSDDIFTLIPHIVMKPEEVGLGGGAGSILFGLLVAVLSIVLSIILAFVTYRLGDIVASVLVGPAPVFTSPAARTRIRKRRPS